jgi:dolichyl-diphosphooligosaccharide--protein glycosyltransferase
MKDIFKDRLATITDSDLPLATRVEQVYHVPVLVALFGFMIYVRTQALSNFRTGDGPLFRGNDPWYHFRETSYLLEHFPSTMPFDVMTNYPTGTNAEQFGTLYDQIVAGVILLTSAGGPSPEYAGLIMLIAAPVFGAAAIIPAYLIAARFAGRGPALVGVSVFALIPGTFLRYTTVGFYDHAAAEVFFQTLGVLGFIAALHVAQQEQPVWELVVDRDFEALKRPLLYAVAAGIGATLYMLAWPPGVLLVGISGIFFAVKLTSDVYHGQSPEPIAFVGVVSMSVTALLMLFRTTKYTFGSATGYTLLQVALPLVVAVGCAFLAALAREWETRDLSPQRYPAVVGGLIALSTGVVSVVLPSVYSGLKGSFLSFIGFSATASARTIGEAQPPLAASPAFEFIFGEYRLALFTAIAGALIMISRPLIRSDNTRDTGYVVGALSVIGLMFLASSSYNALAGAIGMNGDVLGLAIAAALLIGATLRTRYDATQIYVVTWGALILSAAFTQIRFNYYLAAVVAVFNAIFITEIAGLLNVRSAADSLQASAQEIEGWQVIGIVTVAFLIIAPFVFSAGIVASPPAWEAASEDSRLGDPGAVTTWDDSLEWMKHNTPTPGELGGANNPIDPQGTYQRPADDDYAYPEGSYGVQSWWDYGHWTTVFADRIPNANPFQQGATEAANYLLAQNETIANAALDNQMGEEDEGQTRYVLVDAQMASPRSKFSAPTVFKNNVSPSDFFEGARPINNNGQVGRPQVLKAQSYYQSQMIRLYIAHGSAMNPQPIAFNTQQRQLRTQSGGTVEATVYNQQDGVETFNSTTEAQRFVEENPNFDLYGIGAKPPRQVDALEHYRLVHANSQQTRVIGPRYRYGSFVKAFEKVPGATIQGEAPPESEVRAAIEMEIPSTGQTFPYIQYATSDENGAFNMTVPYSTTGYENFGPENGYTNVSVRAVSDYRFRTTGDTGTLYTEKDVTVTESQVLGVVNEPVRVRLTETDPVQINQQTLQAAG